MKPTSGECQEDRARLRPTLEEPNGSLLTPPEVLVKVLRGSHINRAARTATYCCLRARPSQSPQVPVVIGRNPDGAATTVTVIRRDRRRFPALSSAQAVTWCCPTISSGRSASHVQERRGPAHGGLAGLIWVTLAAKTPHQLETRTDPHFCNPPVIRCRPTNRLTGDARRSETSDGTRSNITGCAGSLSAVGRTP